MPEAKQGQRQKNSKLLLPIIVVLFITVVGLIIVVSRNSRSDKGRYTSNASTTNTDSFNNNISTTSQTSTTTQNMSASKAESSPTGKINMVGTWTGKSSGYSSTLIISAQEGNSFRGTKAIDTAATHYETAFNGDIDPVSRKVTIRETSLLRGTSDYSLGVETGLISSDGKEMSGDGTDKYATFTWSYSKQ
ncbi:MAG TPA: hypothetical protein VKB86_12635 [Pyrinomonadaceae bacterium]|nr:hypothetical protein [Pyrinomonadaceae bacterium]